MKTTNLFLLVILLTIQISAVTITPDSSTVLSYGRVQWSDSGVTYDWTGTRFEFSFKGTSLAIRLDDCNNRYDVYIDNELQPILVTPWNHDSTYDIASNLKDTTHSVLIERRTEQHWGKATFREIILYDGGTLLPRPVRSSKRLECIGDSFLAGYGTEHDSLTGDDSIYVAATHTGKAFGALVGKHYDADYNILAFSGKGLIRNANGDSPGMEYPAYYDKTFSSEVHFNKSTPWDFTQWIPQLVLIHLGINDFTGQEVEPADTGQWIKRYNELIDTLRSRYSGVNCVVMCRGDWPHNLLIGAATKVVEQQQAQGNPVYLYHYLTSATGLHYHPTVKEQKEIADGLIDLIDSLQLWEQKSPVIKSKDPLKNTTISLLGSQVSFNLPEVDTYDMSITTLTGRVLFSKKMTFKEGLVTLPIKSEQFSSGVYVIHINGSNLSVSKRFTYKKR